MKRPKTSSKKMSWFNIAGVFLLAVALAVGATTSAQAATGSLDRSNYLPQFGADSQNDFERAWITVTDTTANVDTTTADFITVTIKALSSGEAVSYKLKETGGTTTVFTASGSTLNIHATAVGSTTGYVEDFSGSYTFPGLGTSTIGALQLKTGGLVTSKNGDVTTTANNDNEGILKVNSSDTLALIYGGSTLNATSLSTVGFVGSDDSTVALTKASGWGTTLSSNLETAAVDLKITVADSNENLNPKQKDVIGFADGFTSGLTATGTSRVQVESLDQSSSTYTQISGTDVVARNIMLVETGVNTGTFEATGRVYGTTTASVTYGNVRLGTVTGETYGGAANAPYTGSSITLGNVGTVTTGPGVVFKILEMTASGKIALVGGTQSSAIGTVTLCYDAGNTSATFTDFGTSTWSATQVVASLGTSTTVTTGTAATSLYGGGGLGSTRLTSPTSTGIIKLIDGTDYCLIAISSFVGTDTATSGGGSSVYSYGNNVGSISVTLGGFTLGGPRNGDTIRVSYLDALNTTGSSGTITSKLVFGTTGVGGSLSVDKTTADINDFIVVTMADSNLNTSASTQQSIVASGNNWNGTTTDNRGDALVVEEYNKATTNQYDISLGYPDGSTIFGTQTVRISNTDQSLVWVVPSNYSGTGAAAGFAGTSTNNGSSTFRLGTQTTSGSPYVPLVRGSTSSANSFLQGASTSSFKATLDAADDTVEISPDGTRWVAVPVTETAIDSGTFVGTIGFDCTAVRITTNTTRTVSNTFTDYTGTTTITFAEPSPTAPSLLTSIFGTGSVVRIFDGSSSEIQEVTGVTGTTLTVTKLSNSSKFTSPWETWVQVIGNDMGGPSEGRRETLASGSSVLRIGGYYGATYQIRYNDASGASSAYAAGDTLAVTTSNVGFTTSTGSLSVEPSGTIGLSAQVVVTLVDQDLNTSASTAQTTYTFDGSTWSFANLNELGLGNPVGTSTGNTGVVNGKTAKQILASVKTSTTSSDFADVTNTVPIKLIETDINTGTFKGTLQLGTSTSVTTSTYPTLKVSNGETVTFFYNDSPSAAKENNLSNYTTVSIYPVGGAGVLTLSKDTAFLSGDTVVATVVDQDRNSSSTTENVLTSAVKVTGSNFSIGGDYYLFLKENGVNTGTFLGTIVTGGTSVATSTVTGSDSLSITMRSQQGGAVNVHYLDTTPSSSTSTKTLNLSAYDATALFDADSYSLGTYAVVTLADAEQNTNVKTTQTLLSNVFIQTTSSNSTKVKMEETGVDTGTFKGSIQVASSGGTVEYNRIQAAEGDTVKISYLDEQNTSSSSQTRTDVASVTAAVATPTPAVSPSPGASPTATPVTSPTATPGPSPLPTLSPFPTGLPSPLPTLSPFPTGLPSPLPTLSPVPTTTPTVCEAENIAVSPSKLTLKKKKSGSVTVTVTGDEGCAVEGETVTVTLTSASKKRVSVTPTSTSTDENGQATFTITAKKKTGNARVTFKAGSVKKSITVKVK